MKGGGYELRKLQETKEEGKEEKEISLFEQVKKGAGSNSPAPY